MLHSQNISKVLTQLLPPIHTAQQTEVSPASVSLLPPTGQPLCSVFSNRTGGPHEVNGEHSVLSLELVQNVKIYSLVLSGNFNQDLPWEILELDNETYLVLHKFAVQDGHLILMMVCDNVIPKKLSLARVKLLCDVFAEGLKGYHIE